MITLLLATLALALAGPPALDAHLHATSAEDEHPALAGGGVGVGAALTMGRFWPSAALDVGLGAGSIPRIDLGVGVRAYLTPPQSGLPAWSLLAMTGVAAADGVYPLTSLGTALDVPLDAPLGLRFQGAYLFDGIDPVAMRFTISLTRRRAEAPQPIPVVEPPPEPTLPTLDVPHEHAMIWLPFPSCAWMPLDAADAHLSTLSPDASVQIAVPGFVPRMVSLAETESIELTPAPRQGSLIIVGHSGDKVAVSGHEISLDEAGVTVLNAPVGPVDVLVQGGGRIQSFELAVADGYALWLRTSEPEPITVLFASGDASLSTPNELHISKIAENAGHWGFDVRGAYSSEGVLEANQQLATQRAQAVADVLVAGGVPRHRIEILEPLLPDPDLPLREQRRVDINPVPSGSAR